MNSAIPNNIDKSNQMPALLGANPAQTILIHLRLPVVRNKVVLERLRMERIYGIITKRTAP